MMGQLQKHSFVQAVLVSLYFQAYHFPFETWQVGTKYEEPATRLTRRRFIIVIPFQALLLVPINCTFHFL